VEIATTQEVDKPLHQIARLGWSVDSSTSVPQVNRIFAGERKETAEQDGSGLAHNARVRVTIPNKAWVKIDDGEPLDGPNVSLDVVDGPHRIEVWMGGEMVKSAKITIQMGTDVGCRYNKGTLTCSDIQWLE